MEQTGRRPKWGGDRGLCDASLGRCCASPQMIIQKPVQRLPHGGEITPATGSEPPTLDQRINFRLAQLDPDAAQSFLTPVPVAAHPLGTGRARTGWRSRERRVGHDVPILHRRRGKKEPRRDGGQQPRAGEERPPGARWWSNPSKSADTISRVSHGRRRGMRRACRACRPLWLGDSQVGSATGRSSPCGGMVRNRLTPPAHSGRQNRPVMAPFAPFADRRAAVSSGWFSSVPDRCGCHGRCAESGRSHLTKRP